MGEVGALRRELVAVGDLPPDTPVTQSLVATTAPSSME